MRILLLLITIFAFLSGPSAFAQNFSKNKPTQDQDKQTAQSPNAEKTELSDEDIKQILINEGIPLASTDPGTGSDAPSKYTLGINDVIEIVVARHPEVSGQYGINNEGKIQYEFVGDIKIAGMTKNEVTENISQILSKYIISPDVTIKITGYNSKVVYVIGEVGQPGKIYMRGDTISVREALVQAGLPLLSAKTGDGRLITPAADGKPLIKKINVQKLLYEGDLRENLVMKPGDTLYVPPTFLAKALRAIQPVAAPIGTARTVYTGGL